MMSNYSERCPHLGVTPIRGAAGYFHLLVDSHQREAVLIDTGLVGEMGLLDRILRSTGLEWSDIKAILLTHGHLDHTGNLARIKELSGAPVMAHPLEQAHISGTYPYQGFSRICGALEALGRAVFQYRAAVIDLPLGEGMRLPFWGGLTVLHLPGHTRGHCGFYSESCDLLFSGDLFASYFFSIHIPPYFLNSCPDLFPDSLNRVSKLDPRLILPNHFDRMDPALHSRRFKDMYRRLTLSA